MAAWRKVGYYYSSGLEKSLCKWNIYHVPLVTKGLNTQILNGLVMRGFALQWETSMLFDFICGGSWNFWRPFLRPHVLAEGSVVYFVRDMLTFPVTLYL
jgi:hypothetical protein